MIPEPQRTYVLEFLAALGPAAKDFVIAGAQAIKFAVKDARGTKDVDFILNMIALRTTSSTGGSVEVVELYGDCRGAKFPI
jgi:hypothetical protein